MTANERKHSLYLYLWALTFFGFKYDYFS